MLGRWGMVDSSGSAPEVRLLKEDAMTMVEDAAPVKDVVCGMEIDPKSAAGQMEYQGRTYYFCSHACHMMFMAEPQKYAS